MDEEKFVALRAPLEDLHFHIAEPGRKFAILKKLGPLSDEVEFRSIISFLEQIYKDTGQIAHNIALAFPAKKKKGSKNELRP